MDRCPKCGGKSGYEEIYLCRWHQMRDWNGEGWDYELDHLKGNKNVVCLDCGKRINHQLLNHT